MTGLDILKIKDFANYVYLSAVDGFTYCVGIDNYISKPISQNNQITWVCDPTGLYITREKTPYDTYLDSGTGITFYGATGDYFSFHSTNTASQVYTISAISGTIAGIVYGTYTFYHTPVTSDTLIISQVSSTDFSTYLQLFRYVNRNTLYNVDPVSAIQWGIKAIDHILPATTSALTGATGVDVEDGFDIIASALGDLSMTSVYGKTYTFGNTGLPGIVSAAPLVGVNCSYTQITAAQNVLGVDFIKVNFDRGTVATYLISASYGTSINNSSTATYGFTPNYPVTSISCVPLSFDDSSIPYIWNSKTYNYYLNELVDLTNNTGLMYNISASSPNINIWMATNTTNLSYTPYSIVAGENSSVYFYISTNMFEYGDTAPNYTLLLQVTALSSYNDSSLSAISASIIDTQQITRTISAFPGDTIIDPMFRINYENPRDVNSYMFRGAPSGTTFTITAYDTSLILGATFSGSRIWNFGDLPDATSGINLLSATYENPIIHTYNITDTPLNFNITMSISGARSTNWSGSKNKDSKDTMHFVAVDHLLSADFVAYPTYYFDNSVLNSLNSDTYTNSPGVCAYGEGHAEYFNICAKELPSDNMTYNWQVGNNIFTTTIQSTSIRIPSYANTYGTPGSSISLSVFNNTFLSSMVIAHTGDDGNPTYYPNSSINSFAHTTPGGSILLQNIVFSQYEAPTATIDGDTYIELPIDSNINAIINITLPGTSPVVVNSGNYVWTLSAPGWTSYIQQTGDSFSYTISEGDGIIPGTIGTSIKTMMLLVTGFTDIEIPYLDWPQKIIGVSSLNMISAYSLPDLNIFTPYSHVITGQQVRFDNITQQFGVISAFIWDSEADLTTQTYESFYTSYSTTGLKDVTLSAVTIGNYLYSRCFSDIITVDFDYAYSSSINEIYKNTIKLPYTRDEVLIPANEWVTADNINICFNRLNNNLEYLKNITTIYQRPPISYYGWFGTHSVSGTQWTTTYEHGSAVSCNISTTTGILTSVYDIVSKNDKLYITNNTSVQILSGDINGTLIAERNYKSLDDYFVTPIAIDLSSDSNIYVLDATKNRVVILSYTDSWRFIGSWGGLGGKDSKYKFNYPTDLVVDKSDNVWIVDYKNLAIKQYSKYGGWLQTITSPYFTDNTKPISMAIDSDNNLHVVIDQITPENSIVVLNNNGEYIRSYNGVGSGHITTSSDKNFMYVSSSSSQKIVKYTKDGYFLGSFGTSTEFNGTLNYKGVYHDSNNNLYVSNNNSILKFYDNVNILNLVNNSVEYINNSDIFINKDEYVEAWVYNRCFTQIWYNLELFARGLTGKITINNDGSYSINYIDTISEFTTISNRTSYRDIYIGINELVTADVVNRCLSKLYDFEVQLLKAQLND